MRCVRSRSQISGSNGASRARASTLRGWRACGVEIGGLVPAFDRDRQQIAHLDQLGESRLGIGDAQAKIVAQIEFRGDAQRPGRQAQQLALCFFGRRRRQRLHMGRQHALDEVVDPLEGAAPRRRGDQPGEEQPFDGELAVVPAPPGAAAFAAVGEFGGRQRAAIGDLAQHFVDVPGFFEAKDMQLALAVALVLAGALHAPAEEGMRRQRQQRGLVRPEFEQPALAPASPGESVEMRAVIVSQPREQRQVVRARQHVDGVDLQQTEAIYGAFDVTEVGDAVRARRAKALRGERDSTGSSGGKEVAFTQVRLPLAAPSPAAADRAAAALRPHPAIRSSRYPPLRPY